MKTAALTNFILALLGTLWLVTPVMADSDYDTARQLREAGDILPLETILDRIQKQQPGKVLEVELEHKHGQLLYEIEILDAQGTVWELQVDPRTGKLLQRQEDD